MKKTITIFGLFTMLSCNQKDNTDELLEQLQNKKIEDSIHQKAIVDFPHDIWTSDTIGISKAPVRVLKSQIVRKEYSTYKDIRLTYKNFSDKKVVAIRFLWY